VLGGNGTVANLTGGTQNVAAGAVGVVTTLNGGLQNIAAGGSGAAATVSSGTQAVYGTGSVTNLAGGVQYIYNQGSGTIAAMTAGNQIIANGGTGTVSDLQAGVQSVGKGGTALNTVLNGGTQLLAEGAYADQTTVNAKGTIKLNATSDTKLAVSVGTINANGGTIILGSGNGASATAVGQTLTIASLNGSANFVLNTDLAAGNSDKLVITSATNSTANTIKVNYDPFYNVETYSGGVLQGNAVVAQAPTNVTFTAATTDWGAFRFTPSLHQAADGTWTMGSVTEKETTASENTMTAADSREVIDEAWFNTVNSLSKRLGDLRLDKPDRNDGIWARYQRGTDRAGTGRKAELNANLLQVGYDKASQRKDGTNYVGLAVDHLVGESLYEQGSGTAKATSIALYDTWVGRSGHYYDLIFRQGRFSDDYRVTDLAGVNSRADYGVSATTFSGEYGYRKNLKNGAYLEPQAEIIWGHLAGTNYKTSLGWPVRLAASNHVITRLGLAWGKETARGSYYARTSYYHDFGSTGSLNFADFAYERQTLRDWCEITLGGDVEIAKNLRLYGETTKYLGDLTNNLNFNAGLRLSF
jgi:outer membrane autotransporter protein